MTLLDGRAAELAFGEPAAATPALPEGVRVLFFHKQRTRARLRFLLFASGLATPAVSGKVLLHPAILA